MGDAYPDQSYPLNRQPEEPFMVRLILSTRLVSTRTQADYVLLGIAVIGIIAAFILLAHATRSTPGLSKADIERITELQAQDSSY